MSTRLWRCPSDELSLSEKRSQVQDRSLRNCNPYRLNRERKVSLSLYSYCTGRDRRQGHCIPICRGGFHGDICNISNSCLGSLPGLRLWLYLSAFSYSSFAPGETGDQDKINDLFRGVLLSRTPRPIHATLRDMPALLIRKL